MLKHERHNYIIKQLNLHNKVLSNELCKVLNVSGDTIRRDLYELEEEGKIVKVHGGALSVSFNSLANNTEVYADQDKKLIAKKTIDLIQDGMLVLVGGGTTVREVLRSLPKKLEATFFTVSLSAALELIQHPKSEVIFIGGKISRNTKFSTGGETILRLSEIKADLCILGTNSLDVENGLTDSDNEIVYVKKAMIKASEKVAIITISEKLNSFQALKICDLKEIDYLITELSPNEDNLQKYQNQKLKLL